MTPYEKLCRAYAKFLEDNREYGRRGEEGLVRLITGFADYLEAPETAVGYFPLDAPEGELVPARESVRFEPDGWWSAGTSIALSDPTDPDRPPAAFKILFRLFVQEKDCLVAVAGSKGKHKVRDFEFAELRPIYDAALDVLDAYMTEGIQRLIDESRPLPKRTIGFLPND